MFLGSDESGCPGEIPKPDGRGVVERGVALAAESVQGVSCDKSLIICVALAARTGRIW